MSLLKMMYTEVFKKTIKKIVGKENANRIVNFRWKAYNIISAFFPMQKEILLESYPDFTCNAYEVYRYMIKHGINHDYRITWLVDGTVEINEKLDNVYLLNMYPKGFINRLKYHIHCNRARIAITCNRYLSKGRTSKKQLNVFLDHGSQLKSLHNEQGGRKGLKCDYLICQSDFFIPYNIEQYTVNEEQIVCTGLPRNDQLFREYDSIERLIPNYSIYRKSIVWVPTFRRHVNEERIDCSHEYPLGLPLFNSIQDAASINEVLLENGVILIIKPHPAQDLRIIKDMQLSNIVFVYNKDLAKHNIQTNELLAQTDAMITDYSSIYYDYLLLHRPIAVTLDDFDDYLNEKGFVFERPLDILKGEYLFNISDLESFILNVAKGIDAKKDEREEICNLLHTFQDDQSSKRVVEFIMEKDKERFENKEYEIN